MREGRAEVQCGWKACRVGAGGGGGREGGGEDRGGGRQGTRGEGVGKCDGPESNTPQVLFIDLSTAMHFTIVAISNVSPLIRTGDMSVWSTL